MDTRHDLLLFALQDTRSLGEAIAKCLRIQLAPLEEISFEDGEHKARPLCGVSGKDVFVLQSLARHQGRDVNSVLVRLLVFLGALRDASPDRITLVAPYLCFSRQDRQFETQDPVSTRTIATILESVGIQRIVTLDVHNLAAFQNAFRIPSHHLECTPLFTDYLSEQLRQGNEQTNHVSVLSPDAGGIKRARKLRDALARSIQKDVGFAYIDKSRSPQGILSHELLGEVQAATVIILDDLISSGKTLSKAATLARSRGAHKMIAAATHGVYVDDAIERLKRSVVDQVIISDTLECGTLEQDLQSRTEVLSTAALFAKEIQNIHSE